MFSKLIKNTKRLFGGENGDLQAEVATRESAWDFTGYMGLLPDPDPVLAKFGSHGAHILESLLGDDHLTSVIQQRKLPTLAKEWEIKPGKLRGVDAPRGAERLAAMFEEDLENNVDVYNLISGILDAPLFGMTPIENCWKPGGGQLRIKNLKALPNRWFGFNDKNEPRFISKNNQFEGEELAWGKLAFASHFPTYDNPYGLRLLSRCFWPVTFKKGGVKFWSKFVEKYGMPFTLGKHRPKADLEEKNEMLSKLKRMVQDAVAVVSEGSSVEMLGGDSAASGQIHKEYKREMEQSMSKVILLQAFTTEVSMDGGGYASTKSGENLVSSCHTADQALVKKTIDEIAWIYGQLNNSLAPAPTFNWFEPDDPKKEVADRDLVIRQTGDIQFTQAYYEETYNFKKEHIVLTNKGKPTGERVKDDESDFTEHKGSAFTPEQQRLESLVGEVVPQAAKMLEVNEGILLKAIEEASSFEEAYENLLEVYPSLDSSRFASLFENTDLNTRLYGNFTAQDS